MKHFMWNVIKAVLFHFRSLSQVHVVARGHGVVSPTGEFFWKIPQNGVFWTHVVIMLGGIFNHFCKIVKETDQS